VLITWFFIKVIGATKGAKGLENTDRSPRVSHLFVQFFDADMFVYLLFIA